MIDGILIGLNTALSLQNILIVMIGCFAGTIIGMLPGLGPMTAIALMIPITYGFDPSQPPPAPPPITKCNLSIAIELVVVAENNRIAENNTENSFFIFFIMFPL